MVRKPPSSGPNATAAPMTAPQAANAVARSRPTNVLDMMPIVAGSMSEAPAPSMIASPITSTTTPVDSEASSDPAPNSAAPTMNMRRAPKMSPSRPPMISSAAKVRL